MRSVLLAIVLAGCANHAADQARALTGGDPDRGQDAIARYGCGGCHDIPGVPGADGKVAPPLDGIASRTILAGSLPNTIDNLERWIQHPQEIVPGNVMPDMGVTDADARDIAALLETLR
jgi:cytochrome c2